MSIIALPQPLVDSAWLAQHLAEVKLVDGTCFLPTDNRNARAEYVSEHIPGAVFFDHDQVCEPDTGLPHTWPSAARFSTEMGRLGISNSDIVICYEAGNIMGAARVWWLLKAFGHKQVAVLQGGLNAWKTGQRPIETGEFVPQPVLFDAELQPNYLCYLEDVSQSLGSLDAQIIDARNADRFYARVSEPRAGVRPGHMPGALNLPFDTLLKADGRYKSAVELSRLFAAAGFDSSRATITTCGSGVTAATLILALELMGYKNCRLYDGSWSEWGSRTDTLVMTD